MSSLARGDSTSDRQGVFSHETEEDVQTQAAENRNDSASALDPVPVEGVADDPAGVAEGGREGDETNWDAIVRTGQHLTLAGVLSSPFSWLRGDVGLRSGSRTGPDRSR